MSPEHGIARVLAVSVGGKPQNAIGLAFIVGQRQLITCAHVINAAMGRPDRESSKPAETAVQLEFPFAGRNGDRVLRTARLVKWLPVPESNPEEFFDLDVAALELDEDPPAGTQVLSLHDGDPCGEVRMWGPAEHRKFRREKVNGLVAGTLMGKVDKLRLQVDQQYRGVFRVQKGFSGGPVWRATDGTVVGMVQAVGDYHNADETDAYALGVSVLRQVAPKGSLWPPQLEHRRAVVVLVASVLTLAGGAAVAVNIPAGSNGDDQASVDPTHLAASWAGSGNSPPGAALTGGASPAMSQGALHNTSTSTRPTQPTASTSTRPTKPTASTSASPTKRMETVAPDAYVKRIIDVSGGQKIFDFDDPNISEMNSSGAPADFTFQRTSDSEYSTVQAMFTIAQDLDNKAVYLRIPKDSESPREFDSVTQDYCKDSSPALGVRNEYTPTGVTLYCLKTSDGLFGAMSITAGASKHILDVKIRMWP